MWWSLLRNMPLVILVNVRRSCYSVRDNTLMVVWADDLPEGGYSEWLCGIADALSEREAADFRRSLSMQRLKEAYGKGEAPEIVSARRTIPDSRRGVRTSVVFGRGGGGEVFELRMEEIVD